MRWIATALQVALWLINGLYCKVLALVPRHEAIVARILGTAHAGLLTKLIGCSEILMAIWVATAIRPRVAIMIQVLLIAVMNAIEAMLAPDLLLFGYGNAVFAALLIIALLWYRSFLSVSSSPQKSFA